MIKNEHKTYTELIASEGYTLINLSNPDQISVIAKAVVPNKSLPDWDEILIENLPKYTSADYESKVEELIRTRYSVSAELAILRQRDSKPEEFLEYNLFAEECKREAKEVLANLSSTHLPTDPIEIEPLSMEDMEGGEQ